MRQGAIIEFNDQTREQYMLCQTDTECYAFISLHDGNRLHKPLHIAGKGDQHLRNRDLTAAEFNRLIYGYPHKSLRIVRERYPEE